MSGLPPPSYPGYPVTGPVQPQPPPPPPPSFQPPRASPSHPSQLARSSPSHNSFARSPSHHSSPSHPSQLPPGLAAPTSQQTESDDQSKLRFQVEAEFVQSLANPNYLHFLAQRGFMKDSSFINYLSYLQYWKEPGYVSYLKYPVCLYFLELLQHETFRRECVSGQCARFLDDQVILHWQHYTRRRAKLLETAQMGGVAGSGSIKG